MREIKFRAWNPKYSEMVYFDWHDIDDGCCYTGQNPISELEDVPVMQFTGLHDKNGKEIYEGDIVKSHGKYPLTLHTHPKHLMEVVYDCGYFGVRDLGDEHGRVSNVCIVNPDDWLETEVIGNIWENRELLDDSKRI